jgi:hypothetical protein
MLSFITYKQVPEQIEVLFDEKGIEDLILYLQSLRQSQDHMHLVVGNELDNYEVLPERDNIVCSVKHVRLEYINKALI